MVGAIAYLRLFESIVDAQIAVAGTISAAYPALTVIGALVFLSETLKVAQAIALVAIIGGVLPCHTSETPVQSTRCLGGLLSLPCLRSCSGVSGV